MAIATPQAAQAVDEQWTAALSISKTAMRGAEVLGDSDRLAPGEKFTYEIQVQCTAYVEQGCIDAVLVDEVPEAFIVLDGSSDPSSAKINIDGQTVRFAFNDDLGEDGFGLIGGVTGSVRIEVQVREDLPHELSEIPVTNTASMSAFNAGEVTSSATVTPLVETALRAEVSKSFSPDSASANPGAKTTLTLHAKNASNGSVESLSVTDPANPGSDANPFTYLEMTEVSEIVWPEGATNATLKYWDGTAWGADDVVSKPAKANAPPANAQGVQVTFTKADGTLPRGAEGGLKLSVEQRENVDALTATTTVENTVRSSVTYGGQSAASTPAKATYKIITAPIAVSGTKEFIPNVIVPGGDGSVVRLTAQNSGEAPLDKLTIREPATGDFDERLKIESFSSLVEFPQGATAGSFVMNCETAAGDTSYTEQLIEYEWFPNPPAECVRLKSFEASYTSPSPTIVQNAEVTIDFGVSVAEGVTGSEDPANPTKVPNTIQVTGNADRKQTEPALASDEITIEAKRVELESSKDYTQNKIFGHAGETTTVMLRTVVSPSSTTPAKQIVVSDPALDAEGKPQASAWWDHFTPTQITKTDIPGSTLLEVLYYSKSAGEWKTLVADMGPKTITVPIAVTDQDDIGGLQYKFTHMGNGFGPGNYVLPNFTAKLKKTLPAKPEGADLVVSNCTSATATAPGAVSGESSKCADMTLLAPTPGDYDFMHKTWNTDLLKARSGDRAKTTLNWSTSGLGGVERMVIADTRVGDGANAGPLDAVENTSFKAFDLVAVGPITAAMDPLLRYDTITAVELWNSNTQTWVSATEAKGKTFTGSLPKITLTTAERAFTTSVRLIYQENTAARSAAGLPISAPEPGTGVARSSGNDRKVELEWELRDTVRCGAAECDPALQTTMYNDEKPGVVNNTASATTGTERDESSDSIFIQDQTLAAKLDKTWVGGPIGLPADWTPQSEYPSGRVTLKATNDTPAKVDRLRIVDAAPGAASPFDTFNLKGFVALPDTMSGSVAAKTLVVLTNQDGSIITDPATPTVQGVKPAYARGLTAAQLENVVSIDITYEGRIASAASVTVTFDLQLRAKKRSDDTPVTGDPAQVVNVAEATVEDLGGAGGVHSVSARDDAAMTFEKDLTLGVTARKVFDPAIQYVTWLPGEQGFEEQAWDPVTMRLTAKPTGNARPGQLIVTDDTPTFWNAYRFVGFESAKEKFKLTAPITRVKVDALTGGTFVAEETEFGSTLKLVGATWKEGTPGAAPKLPDGVTADDVQGIRFTFTNTDGTQWENPSTPEQVMPLQVKRRDYLESAPKGSANPVPVPSDAYPAAPGEPSGYGGRFRNTVTALAFSALKDQDGRPVMGGMDIRSADMEYLRGDTEVSMVKTPSGNQKPNTLIPFKLQLTNTAPRGKGEQLAVLDPVIVDTLPLDPKTGNSLLIFDEEKDTPKFEYALTKGDTPIKPETIMPIDPSKVTVEEVPGPDGRPVSLKFSFPKDTVLMPGDVYTVTVNMMFRPGVAAGQQITNNVATSAAEPFMRCNNVDYVQTGGLVECAAAATVHPAEGGALRGQTFVKADDTSLGVVNQRKPSESDKCVPGIDDGLGQFYNGDCVPVTHPLGTETWRERIQNAGTLPIKSVVTINRLPRIGDVGSSTGIKRGSEWTPDWVGTLTAVQADGYRTPDGAKYFYSSAESPCIADLSPTGPACAEGSWLPLTADVDPAAVRHIKTVFDFSSNPFLPGELMGYTMQTRTPASMPKAEADMIAWNTIAIGAQTVKQGTGTAVLATEGLRAGIAFATGSLQVLKEVTGPGASYAPANFALQVQCSVPVADGSGTFVAIDPILITKQITPGQPVLLDEQLPYGSKCQLQDQPGVNGETSAVSSDPVTIVATLEGTAAPLASLTNTYETGAFALSKTVVGAHDQDGTAIDYGEFPVEVECTFMGNPVDIDPHTASLATGDRWLVPADPTTSEIPVGSICKVTETDARGATASMQIDGADLAPAADGSWEFELGEKLTAFELALTNTFEVGAIEIAKEITGGAAGLVPDDEEFVFDVACTLGGTTVWESTETLAKAQAIAGEIITIDTLPVGAACEVTEPDNAGASTTTITADPADGILPTGSLANPVRFTAVNDFAAGSIRVEKEVTGDGADLWGTGVFTVSLACTLDGYEIEIPGDLGADRELSVEAGLTAEYTGLPVGAACELTETATGNATSVAITDAADEVIGTDSAPITVGTGETLVRVINTFDTGKIAVTKEIVGDGADLWGTGTFTVSLACTLDGTPFDVPGDLGAERTLSAATGLTAEYAGLPIGSACELTETATGNATSVAVVDADGETIGEASATISVDAEEVPVRVVNTFDTGKIAVTKEVAGDGADLWGTETFTVSLACTLDGTPFEIPGDLGADRDLSVETGLTAEYAGLPIGSACELTETATGHATSVAIVDAHGEPVGTAEAPIAIDAAEVPVRVINTFDTGSITVTKEILGTNPEMGEGKVFTVELSCTIGGVEAPAEVPGDGETVPDADAPVAIEIPGGAARQLSTDTELTTTYTQLPAGAKCEVRETETGDAHEVLIVPNSGDEHVGTATVAAGEDIAMTVINRYFAPPVDKEPELPLTPGTDPGQKPGAGGTGVGGGLTNTGGGSGLPWLIGGGSLLLLGAVLLVVMQVRRGRGSTSRGGDDQSNAQ